MCLNPRWIYKKGKYKEPTYRSIVQGEYYEIGTFSECGCCEQCVAKKSNNWVVRNHYESKAHSKKCFLTLTYRENPIIIVRKDVQDFMKRFRAELAKKEIKVRMFYCMEYGEINNRPHAHIIVYGWEDEEAKYLDINKKGNILYKSDIVEKTWKLGRTSYQKFDDKEAPYISLYSTPQETFKRAYKLNHDKLKTLEHYCRSKKNLTNGQRKNLMQEINNLRQELEDSKKKYVVAKEINGWSLALGWEEFEKQYIQSDEYVFTEYVQEGMELPTPTPWVKKLANQGDVKAAEEMFRREREADKETNELKERNKNLAKILDRRKKEISEWVDEKDKLEEF